mgnify:CR=1 FL=1
MKKSKNLLVKLSIFIIRKGWQDRLGPKYKERRNIICRFYPDCSNYAILSLENYGFFKGGFLFYKRFKRCTDSNTESCIDYP